MHLNIKIKIIVWYFKKYKQFQLYNHIKQVHTQCLQTCQQLQNVLSCYGMWPNFTELWKRVEKLRILPFSLSFKFIICEHSLGCEELIFPFYLTHNLHIYMICDFSTNYIHQVMEIYKSYIWIKWNIEKSAVNSEKSWILLIFLKNNVAFMQKSCKFKKVSATG